MQIDLSEKTKSVIDQFLSVANGRYENVVITEIDISNKLGTRDIFVCLQFFL